jgi:pimeloyl-ACP methyl ester carboxylesterase
MKNGIQIVYVAFFSFIALASSSNSEQSEIRITEFDCNSITWQATTGKHYSVEWLSRLDNTNEWQTGWHNQTALLATSSTLTASLPCFYRIRESDSPYLASPLLEETFRRQSDIELQSATNWWHAIETLNGFSQWYSNAVVTLNSECAVTSLADYGQVSYVMLGSSTNTMILVSHGGLMGYDNAYILTNLMSEGYSILCPSRPGYPGTPLSTGTNDTFELAADMMEALLDSLGITNRVFVFGTSAGGPTALQFAMRHGERVRGLLLFDAVSMPYAADLADEDNFLVPLLVPENYQDAKSYKLLDATLRNPEAIMRSWFELVVVTNEQTRAELAATYAKDAASVARLNQFTRSITPISQRYSGSINDTIIMAQLPNYNLNQITNPVFVAHSLYDGDVNIENAYNVISNVSGFVSSYFFYGGGHLYFLGDEWANITAHAREFMQRY